MGMNTPDMDRLAAEADGWRRSGALLRAREAFDTILEQDSKHPAALRGRARIALACGDDDTLDWFDRGLGIDPGSADLWLGKAQALDITGDSKGALAITRQLVEQAPNWLEGLRFLAQLRVARGDSDFSGHYASAARKAPRDPNILYDWINQLAALDRFADAAEVAGQAAKAFPNEAVFGLMHASNVSASGELSIADQIFAGLTLDTAERQRNEARHRIRRGEFDLSEDLLVKALAADGGDIAAWALQGLVWRATDKARSDWLHDQDNFVSRIEMRDEAGALDAALPLLHELHDAASMPIGQSLRGGTQTRGNLFDRLEPELGALKHAIEATLEDYQVALPLYDKSHPLLCRRDTQWQLAGSWSVRLSGGGDHHKSHIHPAGVISSALYVDVPAQWTGDDEQAGWLEIGRPPDDLMLDMGPLATIEPKAGYLALFPSTLYHGTRPFRSGRRMSVAFDAVAVS